MFAYAGLELVELYSRMVEEMGERMVKLFESSGLSDIILLLERKYGDRAHR